MRKNLFLTALILMQSIATGCGGDGLTRVRVEGMLTSNGQPLANATVQFIPEGSTKGEGGIGRSSKDGAFQLTGSRDGASGVVPGEYKVRVSLMVDSKGLPLPPDTGGRNRTHRHYRSHTILELGRPPQPPRASPTSLAEP